MTKKTTAADAAKDLKAQNHCITHPVALEMVRKYKTFRSDIAEALKDFGGLPFEVPEFPVAMAYNKKAVTCLLAQKGCEAIRIYPAINKNNVLTLVMVGVDELGESILTKEGNNKGTKQNSQTAFDDNGLIDEAQICAINSYSKNSL